MTFQSIIDTAQQIQFNMKKIVGQTISRSQRIKTQERITAQPFTLTVTPRARFKFQENRPLIQSIQLLDRDQESTIKLGSASGLNYINSYQGQLTTDQQSALTITNFTGTSVTIGGLPSTLTFTATNLVLRAGDWIQPQHSRYAYIVASDVQRGTASVVGVTVHRPRITSENTTVTGQILLGTATSITVVAQEFPTLSLVSRDWAQYDGDFVFVEKII